MSSGVSSSSSNGGTDDDQVIMSGYLTKRGGNIQNWKIRWFVLKKGTLSYYISPLNWEYTKPRGVIYLTKRTEVKETDHRNRRHCFTINPNYSLENQLLLQQQQSPPLRSSGENINNKKYPNINRIYLISAQTVFDQSKWIEMIKLSLNDEKANLKKTNYQLEKVKELVKGKRRDSMPTHPSLLNRTIAIESINDNIKVSLSKRKFYFYHDNLTLPSLSYIDCESPIDLQEIHHQHLMILQQQKDELNKKLNQVQQNTTTTTTPTSSNSTSTSNSNMVSPSISPTTLSPSISPLSTSPPGRKFTIFSTSPPKHQPPQNIPNRSTSPSNISGASVDQSPFYVSPITRLPLLSTSVGSIGPTGLMNIQSVITKTKQPQAIATPNSTSSLLSTSPSIISASLPPSLAYNQLVANSNQNGIASKRHQPKIVVFHLVRDSFQISNIGSCSFNFEILSPFDQNFTLNFVPSSGVIQKGESLTVLVELMAYNHIETDIYSTLHIHGGMEFTLFCRVETDPYLPLFLKSCAGSVLSSENQKRMESFIRNNPTMIKSIQELAHSMISEGRNIIPVNPSVVNNNNNNNNSVNNSVYINNSGNGNGNVNGWNIVNGGGANSNRFLPNQSSPQSFSSSSSSSSSSMSRVKLSKYILNFQRNCKKNSMGGLEPVKIYQLLTDKFLISNSGNADASFQFHFPGGKKNNLFSLSLVPTNGTVSKGEWFYIKSTLTVFVETEISQIVQLIINQREVHYILITVKCENIHPGNKEIDLAKEVVLHERLGTGATGDIFRGLISQDDLNRHISQPGNGSGNGSGGGNDHNWLIARNPSNDQIGGNNANSNGGPQIIVAVKKLHPLTDPSPEMIQDFYNEVRVLSMFNHPNVVKYVGGCTKIANWSIVMEYVPGGNLMDVLANPTLLIPYKLVLRMALDVAKGLHYLHSLGILHLDMKSPNLLVSSLSCNAKVNIKVADFNTCINRNRITAGFFNRNSMLSNNGNNVEKDSKKGTTLWMAPEVIKGAMYSEKCDVYSFAIVMWELVTRKLPYSHISFNSEVEDQVIKGLRPPIPMHCNKNYTDLMELCWDDDAEKRPLFDTVIHSLSKMIQSNDIADQKAKASIKGLRRTQSNSTLNLLSNNGMNNSIGTDNNSIGNGNGNGGGSNGNGDSVGNAFDSPVIITQDLNLISQIHHLDLNTSPTLTSQNDNSNNGTTATTTTTTTATASGQAKRSTFNIARLQSNQTPGIDGEFVHSKHKSKRFSYDGSSTTSILTLNNDSNLPFKFSPPTTPNQSFLQLKKLDKELKSNLQTKKHSFIRYKPSFTNVNLISNNNNNNNTQK